MGSESLTPDEKEGAEADASAKDSHGGASGDQPGPGDSQTEASAQENPQVSPSGRYLPDMRWILVWVVLTGSALRSHRSS